ncbi:fungal-specific transcription factor domain-containing protein [Phyllosticta citricarpa]|uniref:Fungal-specific transcription factor domain-containing protein n=1 Tax=Phyllosticta citricarpa TaxID=55181 RepID=A0ABR1MK54_9PEZI
MARTATKAAEMGKGLGAMNQPAAAVDASTATSTPSGGSGRENLRKRPKSKNGCQRCKLKRLKCDETKPSCRNCVARHIDCPGYGKLLKWCDKYQSYLSGEQPGRSQGQAGQRQAARQRREPRASPNSTTTAKRKDGTTGSSHGVDRDGGSEKDLVDGTLARREASEEQRDRPSSGKKRRREDSGESVQEGDSGRVVECVAPLDASRGSREGSKRHQRQSNERPNAQEVDPGPDLQGLDVELDASPPIDPNLLDIELDDPGLAYVDPSEMGSQTPGTTAEGMDDFRDVEEIPATVQPENILDFNNPAENFLQTFYNRATNTPISSLADPATKLVTYYFSNVCPLYSAFDSALNPFRSAVGQIWDSSPSVYYAIQSMAAAQLANFYPEMIFTGLDMQRKAYRCLQDEMQLVTAGCQSSDRALLTLLLLGPSAAWHDSSDLGLSHLSAARALIYPRLIAPVPPGNNLLRRRNQFFEEALIYWEMLIGFVEPESTSSNIGPLGLASSFLNGNSDSPVAQARKLLPHPWTGIAPKVQTIFAEVGRLIRQERLSKSRHHDDANHHHSSSFFGEATCSARLPTSSSSSSFRTGRAKEAADNLAWATVLEGHLLSASLPTTDDLIDPGDVNTARADFVAVGEAYRCAGLLELYRVFPSLLRKRLGVAKQTAAAMPSTTSTTHTNSDSNNTRSAPPDQQAVDDQEDDTDTLASSARAWYSCLGVNSGHHASTTTTTTATTTTPTNERAFLNSLAMHILSTLSSLPHTSGTMSTQPILLVAAASELRYTPSSLDYWDFDDAGGAAAVRQARAFVVERLEVFKRRLPRRPLERMLELVKEVWRRGGEAFWVDVMVEMGWQTVMGSKRSHTIWSP